MNTKDILQARDTNLPKLLGQILTEGPYFHKWGRFNKCVKCVKCGFDNNNPHNGYDANCPVPNSIKLTPANAFKYRDRAVEKWGKIGSLVPL